MMLLTMDYVHLVQSGKSIIEHSDEKQHHIKRDFLITFFIRFPNVFFAFPLFAISLDWVELCIILRATEEFTTTRYLEINEGLRKVFKIAVAAILTTMIINLISFVMVVQFSSGADSFFRKQYHMGIDQVLGGLSAALFDISLLVLEVACYIYLLDTTKKLRLTIMEMHVCPDNIESLIQPELSKNDDVRSAPVNRWSNDDSNLLMQDN